jgi:hypothetical protein
MEMCGSMIPIVHTDHDSENTEMLAWSEVIEENSCPVNENCVCSPLSLSLLIKISRLASLASALRQVLPRSLSLPSPLAPLGGQFTL